MLRKRILFVDNYADFLNTTAELIEAEGYHVTKAGSVAEAVHRMQTELFHLAIIDIRLTDDNKEEDESGLELANRPEFRALPKIILTGWPSFAAARSMLRRLPDTAAALDFIEKKQGHVVLLQTIASAFASAIPVNWDLVIRSVETQPVSLWHLATDLSEPRSDEAALTTAEELEDLLRRLFPGYRQIVIIRLLWQRPGRVALAVNAINANDLAEDYLVTCGHQPIMLAERQGYELSAPSGPGACTPVLRLRADTIKLAAHAYRTETFDLETALTLKDSYRQAAERSFQHALQLLCERAWPEWQSGQRVIDEKRSSARVYCEKFDMTDTSLVLSELEQIIRYLSRQAPKLGLRLETGDAKLTFHFAAYSDSYANPMSFFREALASQQPAMQTNAPGYLSGENILVAQNERVYLTDFAAAGLWPSLWSFTSLETLIRFDWADAEKLQWLHSMEKHLIEREFSRLDPAEVEPTLRKALRAIQSLRRAAAQTAGHGWPDYQLGIFFQLIQRLRHAWEQVSAQSVSPRELLRHTHVLLAAAMIGSSLKTPSSSSALGELRLDQTTYTVWAEGHALRLQGLSYELFVYLYERANQLCTRKELIETVFKERFASDDASQTGKLNTAISRLRDKIETNPNQPRFLQTEPGRGYRLVLKDE